MNIIPEDRFLDKIQFEPNTGCWLWTSNILANGYGTFSFDSKTMGAHVFSYHHYKGSIPAGLQLDHLCRVRSCVNPEHLEPVTAVINRRRGNNYNCGRHKNHANKFKTQCIHGHAFSFNNTYIDNLGKRKCKTCNMLRQAKFRRDKKQVHANS